jgi:hypothetical protein
MRVAGFVSAALAIGIAMPGPASAQRGGPDYDEDRSGPPQYYTGRPPDPPREQFDRPQNRGAAIGHERRYDDVGDSRPLPWPSERAAKRRPEPSYRRTTQAAPPSDSYRRFWDDGNGRQSRPPTAPGPRRVAPPPRDAVSAPRETPQQREIPERNDGPVARVAVGAHQMVISIAEYESLQNQARELQRLVGTRRDFRDDRGFPDEHNLRDNRDFRNDRSGPRSGPVEIYR